MKLKYALAGAIIVGVATPALAQEFYIVQSKSDKKCTIVEKKPADMTTVVIVGDKVYKTRAEAETQIKVVCKN